MQDYKSIFTDDIIKYFDGSHLRHQIKIKPKAMLTLQDIFYLDYLKNERSFFKEKLTNERLKDIKRVEDDLYITKTIDYGLGKRKTAMHIKLYMSLVEPRIFKEGLKNILRDQYENFLWFQKLTEKEQNQKLNQILKEQQESEINQELQKELNDIKLEIQQLDTVDEKIERLKQYMISIRIQPKSLIHLLMPKTKDKSEEEQLSIKLFNSKTSRRNAEYKLILNMGESQKYSFQTLTLSMMNKQGKQITDFKTLKPVKKLSSQYITILRTIRRDQLKQEYYQELQGLTKREQNQKLSSLLKINFKHFRCYEQTEKGQWHVHFIFNLDLFETFGYETKCLYTKGDMKNKIKANTEFYINETYYQENKNALRYKQSKWFIRDKVIVPNTGKYWEEVVRSNYPNLKPLNPKSQNLQTFEKKNDKQTLQTNYFDLKRVSKVVNKSPILIFKKYLTKYVAKMECMDELFLDAKKKRERLFLFSRGCIAPKVERFLALHPFDLHEDNYLMNYFSEIDFLNDEDIPKDHYLKLLAESTFYPNFFYDTKYDYKTKEEYEYDKKCGIKSLKGEIKYIMDNNGNKIYDCKESKYYIFHYLKFLDEPDFINYNFTNNKFFQEQVKKLKKIFNLDNLRTKKKLHTILKYIRFDNYLAPTE